MDDAELSCSFCLRTAREVDRLLAGAAGHICDACVAACDRILADPSVPFPSMSAETDESLLARLPAADRNVAAADTGLRGLVDLLRGRDVSWARIGEALGVSRQAAWQRFA
ncbi:MAG: ClpX C4-type zinc finger protein [Acidimicrobiales bacterium]